MTAPRSFTPAQEAWIATRPAKVQERVRSYPPDRVYRVRSTGQKVALYSYAEDADGECRHAHVFELDEHDLVASNTFGARFEDLEPWTP